MLPMIDHEEARSVLDSLGDRIIGPGWILIGTVEIASTLLAAVENRYASGTEGILHHIMDLIFPAITAGVGYLTMRSRREYYAMKLKLEQGNETLRLKNERLALQIRAKELEIQDDDTFELGPIS